MYKISDMTCSQIRMISRDSLKNKWWAAILATFICTSVDLVFSLSTNNGIKFALSIAGNIFFLGTIWIGLTRCFLAIIRNEKFELSTLFFMFRRSSELPSRFDYIVKCIGLQLLIILKVILWSFVFIVPGIITAYRYSQAMYLIAERPELNIMEAMELSDKMMQNKKLKLFRLQLSFIGWGILNIFTFGLLSIFFLNPYFICTDIMFYSINSQEYYNNLSIKEENPATCTEA